MFQVMEKNTSLYVEDNKAGLKRAQNENYGLLFCKH